MAHKAILYNDNETLEKIMNSTDPQQIQKLGRQVKNCSKLLQLIEIGVLK